MMLAGVLVAAGVVLGAAEQVSAPAVSQPVSGTVCLTRAGGEAAPICTETSGDRAPVPDSAAAWSYVWRRVSGADVAVGVVPSGAEAIDWPARATALRIRDDANGAAAEGVRIDVTAKESRWQFTLTAREARSLRRLFGPDEDLTVSASAAHRLPAQTRLTRDRLNYELVLVPIPRWSGRVVEKKTRKGVMGVMVTALPQEVVVATTDYAGNFRFEVPDEWPASLRFTAATYGTKMAAAPQVRTETSLPWIELSPAGGLAVEILHEEDLDIELWRVSEEGEPTTRVASQPLRAGETLARFEGLDEGDYEVRLQGSGPFERYAESFPVKAGELSTERIELTPVPLDVFIVREKRGIAFAKLSLAHLDPKWETEVSMDGGGHARGNLWQEGLLIARVSQPGTGGMLITRRSVTGPGPVEWRIELAGGAVTGTVTDSVERFPIAQAKVYLETKASDSTQQLHALTDDQGRFEFAFVPEGSQTVTVSAVGYATEQRTFPLSSAAPERSFRFEMVPTETIAVRVVNSYGVPLVGATLTEGLGALAEQWVTDAEGRVSVPFRRGETKTVYVLPREGSLAIATLSVQPGQDGPKDQVITVPKGEATIDIRTQDQSGAAVPDVELFLRYNGVVIPQAVTRLMLRLQGNVLRTGSAGGTQLRNLPIGYYELWPYFSLAQFQQLQRGPLQPGTVLGATPGNNSVILTFERTN